MDLDGEVDSTMFSSASDRHDSRRRRWVGVAAAAAVVLVVGQLLLPAIAERVVGSRIGDRSADISVAAFPAWKLIFSRADSIRVTSGRLAFSDEELEALLHDGRRVGSIETAIEDLVVGDLELQDVRAVIDHGRVVASARTTLSDLQRLVPFGARLRIGRGAEGAARLEVGVPLLGINVPLRVSASAGEVFVESDGPRGQRALRVRVFENRSLAVETVRMRIAADSLALDVRGALR